MEQFEAKREGYEIVGRFGCKGIIGPYNTVCVPCEFDEIYCFKGPMGSRLFAVSRGGKWGFYNANGVNHDGKLAPCEYDNFYNLYDNGDCIEVKKGDKYGIVHCQRGEIIACKYDSIQVFDNHAAAAKLNDKWGILCSQSKAPMNEVTEFKYDEVLESFDQVFTVKQNGKVGIVNEQGEEITPCEYDNIKFCDGDRSFAIAEKNGKKGIINAQGENIIPCEYDSINLRRDFDDDNVRIEVDGKWGVMSKQGDLIIPCIYDYLAVDKYDSSEHDYSNGNMKVRKNGKWGVIDQKGREIISFEYDALCLLGNSVLTRKDGKWGVVNENGEEIVPYTYEEIGKTIGNDLMRVKQNGKWGVINSKGEEVIPCKYDDMNMEYNAGLLGVWQNGKLGFISSKGKEVVPCKYDKAATLSQSVYGFYEDVDVVMVERDGKVGCLNKNGKEILPCEYDDVYLQEGLVVYKQDDKKGCIDENGEEIIPFGKYDGAGFLKGRTAWIVNKDGKYGLVARKFDKEEPYWGEIIKCELDNTQYLFDLYNQVEREEGDYLDDNFCNLWLSVQYDKCKIGLNRDIVKEKGDAGMQKTLEWYGSQLKKFADKRCAALVASSPEKLNAQEKLFAKFGDALDAMVKPSKEKQDGERCD